MKIAYLLISISVFLFSALGSFAQYKYDYIWPLGYDRNYLNSNGNLEGPVENPSLNFNRTDGVFQVDSLYSIFDGTHGSLCDRQGRLQYISNGCDIRDGEGQILKNGRFINNTNSIYWRHCSEPETGSYPWSNISTMLPDPTDDEHAAFFCQTYTYEGNYLHIDQLSYNEIRGDSVIQKNVPVVKDTLFPGWIASVKTADTLGWWIIQHAEEMNIVYTVKYIPYLDSFEVVPQRIGFLPALSDGLQGDAVFSPDGTRYYTMDPLNHLQIYDFDRSTGRLSNHQNIRFEVDSFYRSGMAISGSGQYLYLNDFNEVYQVDLWADDLAASIQQVGEYGGAIDPRLGFQNFRQQELGPDCRIYISANGSSDHIHVINHPDRAGLDCEFIQDGITFPKDYDNPRDSFVVLDSSVSPNFPNFRLDTGEPVCDYSIRAPLTNSEEVILETGMRILLWPNPVSDILQIDIGHIQNFSGQFILRNALGQIEKQIDIHSGQRRYQIPVYELQPGMYFYEISSAGQSVKSGRVVVK